MLNILHIVQIVSAILSIVLVLIQRASPDMGGSLGGEGNSFLHTRRGAEKFFFFITVLFALIFVASSVAVIILQK